jgi:hypothetical protein
MRENVSAYTGEKPSLGLNNYLDRLQILVTPIRITNMSEKLPI